MSVSRDRARLEERLRRPLLHAYQSACLALGRSRRPVQELPIGAGELPIPRARPEARPTESARVSLPEAAIPEAGGARLAPEELAGPARPPALSQMPAPAPSPALAMPPDGAPVGAAPTNAVAPTAPARPPADSVSAEEAGEAPRPAHRAALPTVKRRAQGHRDLGAPLPRATAPAQALPAAAGAGLRPPGEAAVGGEAIGTPPLPPPSAAAPRSAPLHDPPHPTPPLTAGEPAGVAEPARIHGGGASVSILPPPASRSATDALAPAAAPTAPVDARTPEEPGAGVALAPAAPPAGIAPRPALPPAAPPAGAPPRSAPLSLPTASATLPRVRAALGSGVRAGEGEVQAPGSAPAGAALPPGAPAASPPDRVELYATLSRLPPPLPRTDTESAAPPAPGSPAPPRAAAPPHPAGGPGGLEAVAPDGAPDVPAPPAQAPFDLEQALLTLLRDAAHREGLEL